MINKINIGNSRLPKLNNKLRIQKMLTLLFMICLMLCECDRKGIVYEKI